MSYLRNQRRRRAVAGPAPASPATADEFLARLKELVNAPVPDSLTKAGFLLMVAAELSVPDERSSAEEFSLAARAIFESVEERK